MPTTAPSRAVSSTPIPSEHNLVGDFGATVSRIAYSSVGWAAWLVPVFLFWLFYLALRSARRLTLTRVIAMLACIAAGSGLLSAMFDGYPRSTNFFPQGPGRRAGQADLRGDRPGAARATSARCVLLGTVYAFGLLFVFTKDIGAELEKILAHFSAWREARAKNQAALAAENGAGRAEAGARPSGSRSSWSRWARRTRTSWCRKSGGQSIATPTRGRRAARPPSRPAEPRQARPRPVRALNIVKPEEPKKAKAAVPAATDDRLQVSAAQALLKEQVRTSAANSEEEHRRNAENLLRILGEFGVEVSLGEIHVGPVITRYEVVPAARRARREDRRPRQEHRPGHARAVGPHPGAHPRQGRGRRRGAQPAPDARSGCGRSSRARTGSPPRPSCRSRSARTSRASRSSPT